MDSHRAAALANHSLSRRQLLATSAAAAAATAWHGQLGYGQTRTAAAIPRTIASNASPAFRAVAERLLEAMAEHQVPGAALGIVANGQEEHAAFGGRN